MKRYLAVLILGAAGTFANASTIPPARQALINDIKDMQDFVPAAAVDAATVEYRKSLAARQAQAQKPQNLAAINALRARFEKERNDYLNTLFAGHHREFNDDPAAFNKYVQTRLDLAVTLRKIQEDKTLKLSDAQLNQVAAWRARLGGVTVSNKDLSVMAWAVGRDKMKHASGVQFRSQYVPKQAAPEQGLAAPPAVDLVAYRTQKPILSGLTSLIASALGASKAYAQKVADAISNSSVARNIDERLTAGIVWAESSFSATVGSWAGCLGLGQLSEGVAKQYGVSDRTDIAQNLKGTTGFLKSLLEKYSTHDDRAYVQGLFAQNAVKVQRGADLDATFAAMWPSIPVGMEDAIASYNAGSVPKGKHWYDLPLPRVHGAKRRAPGSLTFLALRGKVDAAGRPLVDHCFDRPDQDNSYCQTVAYVPKVLKNYFTVFVRTAPAPSSQPVMAAGDVSPAANNG